MIPGLEYVKKNAKIKKITIPDIIVSNQNLTLDTTRYHLPHLLYLPVLMPFFIMSLSLDLFANKVNKAIKAEHMQVYKFVFSE